MLKLSHHELVMGHVYTTASFQASLPAFKFRLMLAKMDTVPLLYTLNVVRQSVATYPGTRLASLLIFTASIDTSECLLYAYIYCVLKEVGDHASVHVHNVQLYFVYRYRKSMLAEIQCLCFAILYLEISNVRSFLRWQSSIWYITRHLQCVHQK